HCPADRGTTTSDFAVESVFGDAGNSYRYNHNVRPWLDPSWQTFQAQADPVKGLAEKTVAWVPTPSRFVLLAEPPALPYGGKDDGVPTWTIWHFCRGLSSVHSTADIPQKAFSPILFVDSHVAVHYFSQ